MDAMIKGQDEEERFQKLFSGICDSLNIEMLVPLVEENNISSLKKDFNKGYWKNYVRFSTKRSKSILYLEIL